MTPRERLQQLFRERALQFGDFTLASGKKSSYYVNSKKVLFHAEAFAWCHVSFAFSEKWSAISNQLSANPVLWVYAVLFSLSAVSDQQSAVSQSGIMGIRSAIEQDTGRTT